MSKFHDGAADRSLRDDNWYLLQDNGSLWQRCRTDVQRQDICCSQLYEHLCSDVYVRYDVEDKFVYLLTRNPHVDGFSYCPFCGSELITD